MTDPVAKMSQRVEHIAAQIHRGSAGQIIFPPGVSVWRRWNCQGDFDVRNCAQFTRAHNLFHALMNWVVNVMEALDEQFFARSSHIDYLPAALRISGEGLFTQHVLARLLGSDFPQLVLSVYLTVVPLF